MIAAILGAASLIVGCALFLFLIHGLWLTWLPYWNQRCAHRLAMPINLFVLERKDFNDSLFTLTLAHPDGDRLPGYRPGQYLTLFHEADSDRLPLKRCYSLASWQPKPACYELAIRQIPGGRVSTWLHQNMQPGSSIRMLPPRWKPAWLIKRGAGASRLNFDLHRAGGLWLWGVLFMLALSGAYFNLAQEVFRPVVSLFGTLSPNPVQTLPKRSGVQPAPQLSFEAAIERARALLPEQARNMQPDFVGYMPAQGVYRVGFQEPARGKAAFILGFEQVFLDADTGQLRGRRGYGSGTTADKFLAWQFPLHSGQVLGLPGRIVVCITGLATAVLSITGVLIWNRKRKSSRVDRPVSR